MIEMLAGETLVSDKNLIRELRGRGKLVYAHCKHSTKCHNISRYFGIYVVNSCNGTINLQKLIFQFHEQIVIF